MEPASCVAASWKVGAIARAGRSEGWGTWWGHRVAGPRSCLRASGEGSARVNDCGVTVGRAVEKGLNLPFLESSNPCTVNRRLERFVEADGGLHIPIYLRFSHRSSGGNSRRRLTSKLPGYRQTKEVLGRESAL